LGLELLFPSCSLLRDAPLKHHSSSVVTAPSICFCDQRSPVMVPITVVFNSSQLAATLVSQPAHDGYQMFQVRHDYRPHRLQSSPICDTTCCLWLDMGLRLITAFVECL
jgi:hypothetical protein